MKTELLAVVCATVLASSLAQDLRAEPDPSKADRAAAKAERVQLSFRVDGLKRINGAL